MKKIAGKIAMVLVLIMLAGTVTGCNEVEVLKVTGEIVEGTVELAGALGAGIIETGDIMALDRLMKKTDEEDTF